MKKHGTFLRTIGLREMNLHNNRSRKKRKKKFVVHPNVCNDCETKFSVILDSCPNCYGENITLGGKID